MDMPHRVKKDLMSKQFSLQLEPTKRSYSENVPTDKLADVMEGLCSILSS